MADMEYTFKAPGGCRGQVTGTRYDYKPGDMIRAPEGELTHLRDNWYTSRPLRSKPNTPDVSGDVTSSTRSGMTREEAEEAVMDYHKGAGWYDVPGAEKSVRKEEAIDLLVEQ